MKEPRVSKALRIVLYVIFVLGVVGTATLPFLLEVYIRLFYDVYSIKPGYRAFILAFLITVALLGLWAVLEMIRMLRSVPKGPFTARNVRALYRIGAILVVIALLFLAKCFAYVTFLTMACAILFTVCALFAFTLASLFRQAVAFKEENDLTI